MRTELQNTEDKMHINGIDEKDNEIINILLNDARISYSAIGERIGLSRTAVKKQGDCS